MISKEIWKSIDDFPSYEVSNLGQIRNKNTKHIKTAFHDNDGYLKVTLMNCANGKKQCCRKSVHRLVATSFLGDHPDLQVNHINGIKDDNQVDNLEWVTNSQNVKHAYDSGIRKPSGGRGPIRKIQVIETGEVYDNLHECARAIKSDSGRLSRALNGEGRAIKGFHVRYAQKVRAPFLYDYQMNAVKQMHNGCILNGGVGSGKSRTGLFYYFKENGGWIDEYGYRRMKKPKDLYIITTAMKRDTLEWNKELAQFSISTDPKANFYNNKVVIDSWNNIKKYIDVKNAFFLLDEQKVCGSGAWVKAFLKIAKQNDWILLSATAGDVWSD